MESRKVQLAGNSTFTVSLPKTWATEHGIEAGQEVSLFPYGQDSLVVQPGYHDEGTFDARTAVGDLDPDCLRRMVGTLYEAGYDRYALVADETFSTAQRRAVTRAARSLIGLEVNDVAPDRIVLRNLLDPGEVSVRQTLVQLRMTVLSMHEEAVATALGDETRPPERIVEMDDEADRLSALIGRTFRRALMSIEELDRMDVDLASLYDVYVSARHLERVADHATKIARIAAVADDGPTADSPADDVAERVRALGDQARWIVDAATTALNDGDVQAAADALDDHRRFVADLEAIDRELLAAEPVGGYRLGVLLDSLRRTGEHGRDVAHVAIQSESRVEHDP